MARRWLTVIATLAAVLLVGGVAWAAIPHSDTGVHTGCYKTSNPAKGAVIVIDAQAGETCPNGYTPMDWDLPSYPNVVERTTQVALEVPGQLYHLNPTCDSNQSQVLLSGGYIILSPDLTRVQVKAAIPFFTAPISTTPDFYHVEAMSPNGDGVIRVYAFCGDAN
jgi:hypothetical protein